MSTARMESSFLYEANSWQSKPLSADLSSTPAVRLEGDLKREGIEPSSRPGVVTLEEFEKLFPSEGASRILAALAIAAAHSRRPDLLEWLVKNYVVPEEALYAAFVGAAARGGVETARKLLQLYPLDMRKFIELGMQPFITSVVNNRAAFAGWLASNFDISDELGDREALAQLVSDLLVAGNLAGAKWLEDKFAVVSKLIATPPLMTVALEGPLKMGNLAGADWLAATFGSVFPMLKGSRYVSELLMELSADDRLGAIRWLVEGLDLGVFDVFGCLSPDVAMWFMGHYGSADVADYLAKHYDLEIPEEKLVVFDPNNKKHQAAYAEYRVLWEKPETGSR